MAKHNTATSSAAYADREARNVGIGQALATAALAAARACYHTVLEGVALKGAAKYAAEAEEAATAAELATCFADAAREDAKEALKFAWRALK